MNTQEQYAHYARVRNDPAYRLQGMMEVLEDNLIPPLYAVPGEEVPLPVVLPEHRLMNKVKQLEGITYNTRQVVQERFSKKKDNTSYIYSSVTKEDASPAIDTGE